MKIVTSSLAMRFYRAEGWTLEALLPCVRNTSTQHNPNGGAEPFLFREDVLVAFEGVRDVDLSYWIPEVGTTLDIKKLLGIASGVERTFNDYPGESDEEHLGRFNW